MQIDTICNGHIASKYKNSMIIGVDKSQNKAIIRTMHLEVWFDFTKMLVGEFHENSTNDKRI